MQQKTELIPFLKWPGGKRWFVEKHAELLPGSFDRYIEPFLGAGSVYFFLQPKKALLGDLNPDVINAYRAIKVDWRSVEKRLQLHNARHSQDYYYKTRDNIKPNLVHSASRMIYLNRTCFNGIYRVNLEGHFNVPIGTKNKVILETDNFERISKLLIGASLKVSDFESLIDKAKYNDFIFADPPYTVRHNLNGFIKYNEQLFSWDDQVRLAKSIIRAKERGVKIVLTNANHESIRKLYRGNGFRFKTVSRYSSIAANGQNRTQFEELVIYTKQTK